MGLASDINPPLIHQVSVRVCTRSFEGRYTHIRVKSLQPTRSFPSRVSLDRRTGLDLSTSSPPFDGSNMPAATAEPPSVALSCTPFTKLPCSRDRKTNAYIIVANNFWGKDDAGVGPLLERMHGAKTTCDELKAFYSGTYCHVISRLLAVLTQLTFSSTRIY